MIYIYQYFLTIHIVASPMRFFLTNITVTSQTSSSKIKHLSLDYVTVYRKMKSLSNH